MKRRARLFNCSFDPFTLSETIDEVFRLVETRKGGWICTVNVAILMMMRSNARLQRFVDNAALVVADGQPIIWCSRRVGNRIPHRVTGIDLVDGLCERAQKQSTGIYLLGATPKVARQAAEALLTRYPNLSISFDDGYFSPDEAPSRADKIRESNAKILLVGMGVPRQEYFLEEQWDRLGTVVAIGVGGSFDVLSGTRRRAPAGVQRLGLEWLFRLVQEPRRLFPRYLVTNCQFLWLVLLSALSGPEKRGDYMSSSADSDDVHSDRA